MPGHGHPDVTGTDRAQARLNPAHLATCDEEAGHLAILDDIDAEARRSARIPPSDGIVTRRACARLIERPVDRETRVVVEPRNMPAHRRGVLEFRSEEHTSELQSLMRISYAV